LRSTEKALSCPSPIPENDDNPFVHPAHVRERDIDLLLLEELYGSNRFQTHFLDLLRCSADKRSPQKSLAQQAAAQLAAENKTVIFTPLALDLDKPSSVKSALG